MKNTFRKYEVDWEKEIEEYNASESTMKKFCENKNYNRDIFAYHYYRKKKSENAISQQYDHKAVFLPVEIVERQSSVININGYHITVTSDTDMAALKTVLMVIGEISWN